MKIYYILLYTWRGMFEDNNAKNFITLDVIDIGENFQTQNQKKQDNE